MKEQSQKKKIVLFGLNGRGGPLTYSCIISSYLAEYCDVSLLLPSYSIPPKISKKVSVIRITAPPNAIKTLLLTFNIFQHIKIIKTVNKINPDVLNILDIHPWYVMYWPFLKAKKKIVTINDPEVHSGEGSGISGFVIKKVTKFLLTKADYIITLSKNQEKILRNLGYKQRITSSKLGNQQEFSIKNKKIKKFQTEPASILAFGRIREYKGLNYLLESLIHLKNEGLKFKLIIAGEGDIAPYRKLITKLGSEYIEEHIEYVSDEKLSEYFQRVAFTVLPYTDATQTGIASIAYNFKKPLIVTNVGSLPEVVINGKTGIVIEPKNAKQLSKALKELLSNPNRTKEMGIEGNKFLKKEYSWDIIVKKIYEEAYK